MFLESGDFYWNSGIFIWNIKSILSAFEKHLPEMYSSFEEGKEYFGTKQETKFIGKTYATCRNISIDYGIMEKADNVYVMCTDIGWSDLGTWSSLYEHSAVDKKGNSKVRGEIFSYDSRGNIFNIAPGKIAVVQGLKDYIVVDSGRRSSDCKERGRTKYKELPGRCKKRNRGEIPVTSKPQLAHCRLRGVNKAVILNVHFKG